MLFTSCDVETFTPVLADWAKVAISGGPLGGPPGVQLFAIFPKPKILRGQQPGRAACQADLGTVSSSIAAATPCNDDKRWFCFSSSYGLSDSGSLMRAKVSKILRD